SSEGVLRLVNDDGQVVAAEASVEPGTHVLLWIPSGLAPGTYRVELAPELGGEAFDSAEIELVPLERYYAHQLRANLLKQHFNDGNVQGNTRHSLHLCLGSVTGRPT